MSDSRYGVPLPPPERPTRFPALLVGAAVLLALLIVLTPVLITGGGAGGTFITQAEVVVDHPPNSPITSFVVRGVGAVRYTEIRFGLNDSYDGVPVGNITWNAWSNQSSVVALVMESNGSSLAVNVSVEYQSSGSSTSYYYYGVLSAYYDASAGTIQLHALSGGMTVPSSPIPVGSAELPLIVPLDYLGTGVPP